MTELKAKDKELTIELINKCPAKCVHCSTEASPEGEGMLKFDYIERKLAEFPDFNIVRLSGGEPFEHPQLVDIVELLHKQQKQIEILTCGAITGVTEYPEMPEDKITKIAKYRPELIFSIQGVNSIHDHIARTPGLAKIVEQSISLTRQLGLAYSIHTVAMHDNYPKLPDLAAYLGEHHEAAHWHILRLVKQGRATQDGLALTESQNRTIPALAQHFERAYGLKVTYTRSFKKNAPACACHRKQVILYTGDVADCSALKDGTKGIHFACKDRI